MVLLICLLKGRGRDDETMGCFLSEIIDSGTLYQTPDISHLETMCGIVRLLFVSSVTSERMVFINPAETTPTRLVSIVGDGNCLFSAMAVLLTGDSNSSSNGNSSTMRDFICNRLLFLPFTVDHFNIYSDFHCANAKEYVQKENMCSSGTYGGDIEISTFCTVFEVQMIVYVQHLKSWRRYRPLGESRSNIPAFFLLHNVNHWEPIVNVSSSKKTQSGTRTTLKRKHELSPFETLFEGPQPKFHHCPSSNLNVVEPPSLWVVKDTGCSVADLPRTATCVGSHCRKCRRHSSTWHPLNFNVVSEATEFSKKSDRAKIPNESLLCDTCLEFVRTPGCASWKLAWPYVMSTLRQTKVFQFLPLQLRESWLKQKEDSTDLRRKFVDVTNDFEEFWSLIRKYTTEGYVKAMQNFALPSIRCFCGASVFIYDCGVVDFCHWINYIDPSFKACRANWKLHLACIRNDFMSLDHGCLPFLVQPSVLINEKGLQLVTCKYHNGGSKFRMIHVPTHPLCGNLSHPHDNRLAPLAPTLRGAKPMKIGSFSHTYTMSKATGGFHGVGSLLLHTERKLNVKSDFLLPCKEYLLIRNRKDMFENISSIAEKYHLDSCFIDSLQQKNWKKPQLYDECVSGATYVRYSSIKAIKEKMDKDSIFQKQCFPVLESLDPFSLVVCKKALAQKYYSIALIFIIFANVSELNALLFSSTNNTMTNAIKQLLSKLHINCSDAYNFFQSLMDIGNLKLCIQAVFESFGPSVMFCESLPNLEALTSIEVIAFCVKRGAIPQEVITSLQNKDFVLHFSEKTPVRDNYNVQVNHADNKKAMVLSMRTMLYKRSSCLQPSFSKLLIFVKKARLPTSISNYFSGQSLISCPHHKLRLCVDFFSSGFRCVLHKCTRKSKWRCPQINRCPFAICKKHAQSFTNCNEKLDLTFNLSVIKSHANSSDQVLSTESESEDEINFAPPLPTTDFCGNTVDTDAALTAMPVACDKSNEDMRMLPLQGLLNSYMSVMNRPKYPPNASTRFNRALQSFAAILPTCSISLLQLEALLFPSVFYHQLDDGTFPGAIPFFLYAPTSQCENFQFHDLLQHFRTRMTDITLLTSSSTQYIQFMIDILINCALGKSHSIEFFQKGLQSLQLPDGKRNKLFNRAVNYFSTDSEIRVSELTAAVSNDTPHLFLTLSANQKDHPALSKIFDVIENKFSDESDEIRKAGVNSMMCTMVRAWSNSVQFLIDLLLKSEEKIIGHIRKIWGRAEFQTTAGNLPHYHILVWLHPGSFDLDELVQCSEKAIRYHLQKLFDSNVGAVNSPEQLQQLFELAVKVHSHDCSQGNYRCMKRRDEKGNKICRTPPFPPSHCHWELSIDKQYPEDALRLMEKIGMAKKTEGSAPWLKSAGVMMSHKYMYAAAKDEHIVPTNSHLFTITRSSTNLLAVTEDFACAYLTDYLTKKEEHADGSLLCGGDGKSFRLRNEGIVNRHLSSVRHFMKIDKQRERKKEKVTMSLLSITEGVHWALGLPVVLTNMKFVNIPNVPPEDRFVLGSSKLERMPCLWTLRDQITSLAPIFKLTTSQKILQADMVSRSETVDKITQFGLRSPELLCVDKIDVFFKCFTITTCHGNYSTMTDQFVNSVCVPWLNCLGKIEKVRSAALQTVIDFLSRKISSAKSTYILRVLNICKNKASGYQMWLDEDAESLLPEIVFRNVSPRFEIKFLVSFLLRFGYYETELDLFSSGDLRTSFVLAHLVNEKASYSDQDVLQLLRIYAYEELRFLPGSTLIFSSKLLMAHASFSHLLNVNNNDLIPTPTVLVGDLHREMETAVVQFLEDTQQAMFQQVQRLQLQNMPQTRPSRLFRAEWVPVVSFAEHQSAASVHEQNQLLNHIYNSIRLSFLVFTDQRLAKNDLILGPPGSGKSYVSRVALAYALMNGLTCMITSLAARRSNQLGGEHIHRLFRIPCKNASSYDLAEEALVRLSSDIKRKSFLERLQMLIVEEISVLNAETFGAISLIFQKLKGNDNVFGGVYVLANGDCCQLPNVSGCDVFSSSTLLFSFEINFLRELVRMEDENGRLLLRLMEKRPIPAEDIEIIVGLFADNCNFVSTWSEVHDPSIMKVFGKKSAEREALDRYFNQIAATGISSFIIQSRDEVSILGSNSWRPCDETVSNFLNCNCREPRRILLHPKGLLRLTRNLNSVTQGTIAVVDFDNSSQNSVSIFCAPTPDSVNEEVLNNLLYLHWNRIVISRQMGFTLNYRGNSARRNQFPICNYVATNCHRLLGDELPQMATSVSSKEHKYSLWLPSQIFVLGSRVRHLRRLTFVGDKKSNLNAIKSVLLKRNLHEERVYSFFSSMRDRTVNRKSAELPLTRYRRLNFDVPSTPHGFVYGFVSMKNFKHIVIFETEKALSEEIRAINNAEICDNSMYSGQPWAVAFFVWNFESAQQRFHYHATIRQLHTANCTENVNGFCSLLRVFIQNEDNLLFTICGELRDIDL